MEEMEMVELPEVLDREVSFSREVQPILLLKGGPHAVVPQNSPAPAGVRFDSYRSIMARHGLVVPGSPMESELVTVLLEKAMAMPPAGDPLSEQETQMVVSWVAQGARDN